jgi:hypothetical protein
LAAAASSPAQTFVDNGKPSPHFAKRLEQHREWLSAFDPDARASPAAQVDPRRLQLRGESLDGVDLAGLDLSDADLKGCTLSHAVLRHARLNRTLLDDTDLSFADLLDTDLKSASLRNADLTGCRFEPVPGNAPDLIAFRFAKNIERATYRDRPDALIELRDALRRVGRSDVATKLDYVIQSTRTAQDWTWSGWPNAFYRWLAWDVTTKYGMEPGRALLILLGLVPAFAIVYWFALAARRPLVFKVLPEHRIGGKGVQLETAFRVEGARGFGAALYYSLLQAVALGVGDVNVGSLIGRLQPEECELRSIGWVRVLSGTQQIIGLALLAVWAVMYFGHPLD